MVFLQTPNGIADFLFIVLHHVR